MTDSKVLTQAKALLSKAKTLLVLDSPFFASCLLKRPIELTEAIPTACVDPRGLIRINPNFIAPLNANQVQFLLAHECMHYMLLHGLRRGHRQPGAWNQACDAVINETLLQAKVGEFIDGGVRMPGAELQNAEALYMAPPEGEDSQPGGIGSDINEGSGSGEGQQGDGQAPGGQPLTEGEVKELEAQAKIDMVQAMQAAKMQGKLPANLQRMVESLIEVRTPWYDILERYMVSFRKDEYSWSKPNRRHIADHVYLPGQGYVPEMGPVVVGVDTSGSIGQKELAHFGGHINRIIEQCRPSAIHVVYCDAAVAHVDQFTCEDLPIKLNPHGGGGTDMTRIFDWVEKEGLAPDTVVVLTDGYTPFGQAPNFPVIWLMTTDEKAPYGENVRYYMEEH